MTNIKPLFSSKSTEWYTPIKYINSVKQVLGNIELDPASCQQANETIKACKIFTSKNDGLNKQWVAKTLFLNPPYGLTNGKSNQALWSKKLISEYEAGNVHEAILLVNASTSEKWFKPLFNYPICFTDHRIKFDNTGAKNQPTKGNAFIYFGPNIELFTKVFSVHGTVILKI